MATLFSFYTSEFSCLYDAPSVAWGGEGAGCGESFSDITYRSLVSRHDLPEYTFQSSIP